MPEKILTGTVSDYNSEEAYDSEGNYYVHYKFSIDGHSLFCKTDKTFIIYDGHKIIVKVQEEESSFKVIGMINLINDTSFGKTSGLKSKAPEIEYELVHSILQEKQQQIERVHSSNYSYAQRHFSFKLILENGMELQTDAKTGKSLRPGDHLCIFKPIGRNGVSEYFNLTTGKNSKPTPFLSFFFMTMLIASLTGIFLSWKLPWSEKGFIVILGGLFSLIGLLGCISEQSIYFFRKKRYNLFIEKLNKNKIL